MIMVWMPEIQNHEHGIFNVYYKTSFVVKAETSSICR